MAPPRVFDVPGDEPGQTHRAPDLRLVEQPKLQGPAGQPVRAHPAHEPRDGGGGGDRGSGGRCARGAQMKGSKDRGIEGSRGLIRITTISGRPIPLRGNDMDTDRIIPARFMKAVTFDGIGQYAFYDVRFDADGRPKGHVLDDPRYRAKGPRVAIVNKNFGCGSSREHAPQALLRWGIKALVGESFADIFFGNCVALGIPCVTASEHDVRALTATVEND